MHLIKINNIGLGFVRIEIRFKSEKYDEVGQKAVELTFRLSTERRLTIMMMILRV